jgi:hypothetical protein
VRSWIAKRGKAEGAVECCLSISLGLSASQSRVPWATATRIGTSSSLTSHCAGAMLPHAGHLRCKDAVSA